MLRRSLPLLAALVLFAACQPAIETSSQPAVARSATSDFPPLLDPAPPRDVVLGKLFAPDGSIQPADRATAFAPGKPILLSVEAGDLPRGTAVISTWTAPDGTVTDQKTMVIGGEAYLTFTAPSTGWAPGAGRVTVRIGETARELSRQEIPFELSASFHTEPTPTPTPAPEP